MVDFFTFNNDDYEKVPLWKSRIDIYLNESRSDTSLCLNIPGHALNTVFRSIM